MEDLTVNKKINISSAAAEVVQPVEDCAICCESFNMSSKKKIKCPYCDYCACKSCVRQYLTTTTKEPHCMNCKKAWSQNFMVIELDRSFNTKEYKNHRKSILLEGEVSKLPETMRAAENYQKKEELEEENRKLKNIEADLRRQLRDIAETHAVNSNAIWRISTGQYKKGEEKRQFIMACPDEGCRGFLSSAYKCELCKLYTCPKCYEIIGDKKDNPDHVCNEDSVKSAELIKSETKPCPSCGTRIFKIDGCDQMWCTECHVAFSWRTGRRETGIVHNPHFYQWQRDTNNGEAPRVPGDNPCANRDRMPNWWDFRREWLQNMLVEHIRKDKDDIRPFVVDFLTDPETNTRIINDTTTRIVNYHGQLPNNFEDYSAVVIKRVFTDYLTEVYRRMQEITYEKTRIDDRIQELTDNEEIRIHYLLKKISKDEMGTKIIRRDTMRRKIMEMSNIYDLLVTIGRETFHYITDLDIRHDPDALKKCCAKLKDLSVLREYCNKQFELISISYNCKVPLIHPNWQNESKSYKLSVAKKKASKKRTIEGTGEGDGGGEGEGEETLTSIQSNNVDQKLLKDVAFKYVDEEAQKFEFTLTHLFSETDFPTDNPQQIYKAAMTFNMYASKEVFQELLYRRFDLEEFKNKKIPKKPKNFTLRWPSRLAFTITTRSCGNTEGVKRGELEYLLHNHNNEEIDNRRYGVIASEWMSENNEVFIQWNGSVVNKDKLQDYLKLYYTETDRLSKMSIEEATIEGEKELAQHLARTSGVSLTSDTLEGRIQQHDWDYAKELARQRIDETHTKENCVTA